MKISKRAPGNSSTHSSGKPPPPPLYTAKNFRSDPYQSRSAPPAGASLPLSTFAYHLGAPLSLSLSFPLTSLSLILRGAASLILTASKLPVLVTRRINQARVLEFPAASSCCCSIVPLSYRGKCTRQKSARLSRL